MSAVGHFIPPMLLFPRARLTEQLQKGAPPETLFSCNTSGWMTIADFSAWFEHFLAHTRHTKESPVLLLLDGHASHTKNLDFLDNAKRSYVTVISLPPHCSHKLQPLDVSFMAPLKTNLSQVIEAYLKKNPGKVITLNEISALFRKAYLRSLTASVAVNGFRKTGIVPFNRSVFTDDDFVPADVSDIPFASANVSDIPSNNETEKASRNDNQSDDEDEPPFLGFDDVDRVFANNASVEERRDVSTKSLNGLNKSFSIGPLEIRPLPKIALKEQKRGRKKEKSAELTSRPHRNALKLLQATKEINQLKTTEKVCGKRPQGKPITRRRQKENRDVRDILCESCGICFSSSGDGNCWEKCIKCHMWCAKTCISCSS
ncbi:uncharacterized protein LOC135715053 [Ochlerotatus camptorhynchus]|uniref:uncharacterized protein LOC135715053 n=1 Tax=Ochlerotatus camptorhynchus TaxID=644619 RepID=UPI0031DA1445